MNAELKEVLDGIERKIDELPSRIIEEATKDRKERWRRSDIATKERRAREDREWEQAKIRRNDPDMHWGHMV